MALEAQTAVRAGRPLPAGLFAAVSKNFPPDLERPVDGFIQHCFRNGITRVKGEDFDMALPGKSVFREAQDFEPRPLEIADSDKVVHGREDESASKDAQTILRSGIDKG